MIMLTLDMMAFFLFQVMFGVKIYRHFCTASIYYFSRCPYRIRWFIREAASLGVLAFIYSSVLLATEMVVAGRVMDIQWDKEFWALVVYEAVAFTLWLLLTTLAINVVAMRYASVVGFAVTFGLQMAGVTLLLLFDRILPLDPGPALQRNAALLKLNPIANLVLCWHSSSVESLDAHINQFQISFDLLGSLYYYGLLLILVVILGCILVKKQEFLMENTETGR
jgi:hypothetical protein